MKENNKLLAEYLNELTFDSEGQIKEDLEKLDFHYNWNSLMRAVEKIESLGLNQRKFTVKISYDVCSIDFTSLHERRETPLIFKRSTDQRNKIEAVYNACVEFVEWWNENKS